MYCTEKITICTIEMVWNVICVAEGNSVHPYPRQRRCLDIGKDDMSPASRHTLRPAHTSSGQISFCA